MGDCRSTWLTWMWYQWGALMINQFKGRDVIVFGNGGTGTGIEVLEYYSLDKMNECECIHSLPIPYGWKCITHGWGTCTYVMRASPLRELLSTLPHH